MENVNVRFLPSSVLDKGIFSIICDSFLSSSPISWPTFHLKIWTVVYDPYISLHKFLLIRTEVNYEDLEAKNWVVWQKR